MMQLSDRTSTAWGIGGAMLLTLLLSSAVAILETGRT